MTRSRADGYIAGVLQRTALISGFIVSLPTLVAAVDGKGTTPSIFAPASTPAFAIRELALFALGAPLSPWPRQRHSPATWGTQKLWNCA